MKKISYLAFACLLVSINSSVLAHRSGCHRWHSCPSDTGSYTCGDTGHSNYCPINKKNYPNKNKIKLKDNNIDKTKSHVRTSTHN